MELKFSLEEMKFFAFHGIYPEERTKGNEFVCSLTYTIEFAEEVIEDNLSKNIDCQEVYAVICREMKNPSYLIEHLSFRIAKTLLQTFHLMKNVEVKISKLTPPNLGNTKCSSATIYLERERQ